MTTINVTAEHIAAGTARKSRWCPIALAICDAFPSAVEVSVFRRHFYFRPNPHFGTQQFNLPAQAAEFVERFDFGGAVEPFSFDVDYPEVTA